MRNLLALANLPREGPSVRPRVLAFAPALAERGIRLRFRPFLSSRGFRGFYSTRLAARLRKLLWSGAGYARRLAALLADPGADGVLVHREIVPRWNPLFLSLLVRRGLPIAYDLDDATWLSPREYVGASEASRRRMSRLKRPAEVEGMMAAADLVLAGNAVIAGRARGLCPDVRMMPSVVDTEVFRPRERAPRERPLVGWVGSPTATYCLKEIAPALARAAARVPFDLLVAGAGEPLEIAGVRTLPREWTLEGEAGLFASLDVGLYPLPDNEWTRGKCGMKAIQYLSCGVPAVVSPVGVNREIVGDGVSGAFARDAGEWEDRLVRYLADPGLRERHGRAGREVVVARWSLRAWSGAFVRAVEDLLG